MANTLRQLQKELNLITKTIEVEQDLFVNKFKIQLQRMANNKVSKEETRRFLNTPAGLMEWDKMKNQIRQNVASLINQVGDLGYYEGLRNG